MYKRRKRALLAFAFSTLMILGIGACKNKKHVPSHGSIPQLQEGTYTVQVPEEQLPNN